jgi:hypothetical protein
MNTVRTYVLYDSFGGDVGNGGGAGFWCPRGYGGGKRYSTVLYGTVSSTSKQVPVDES